jgi:Rrf2 family iron-sulfur cluster assembly transcriptional regulator
MKLTTRGRYAVQAIIDLINNGNGRPVKLQDISDRQKLSISYLEQLFRQLRIGGIVKSVRGPGGGYVLNKDPGQVSIEEILKAVKELTTYSDVIKLSAEATKEETLAHQVITRTDEACQSVLKQTLASLL